MQVGSRNIKNDYEMCSVKIKSVRSVKDLGVTVTSNLKISLMCNESVWKANRKKLGAYAEAARDLGGHLHDISPWACGRKESITPIHRASDNWVTTVYLSWQQGHKSLLDIAYLLTTRWIGEWVVSEKLPKFYHSAWALNPRSLGCEPSVLSLHHRAPKQDDGFDYERNFTLE